METRQNLKKKMVPSEDKNKSVVDSSNYTTECVGNSKMETYKVNISKRKNVHIDQEIINQPDSCIEVCGRKTRLKKIKKPLKNEKDKKYETEEFIGFNIPSNDTSKSNFEAPNKEVTKELKQYQMHTSNNKPIKVYVDPKKDNCNIPKQVVSKEYRLVMAKLREFKIFPPDVKVIIKDALYFPEATRKKIKLFYKSKQLITLLPSNIREEIKNDVENLNQQLQPKINIIKTFEEMEETTYQIVQEFSKDKPDTTQACQYDEKSGLEPYKIELLKKMSDQLQLLIKNETKIGDTNNASKVSKAIKRKHQEDGSMSVSSNKKITTFESSENISKEVKPEDKIVTPKSLLQIQFEEKIASLGDQLKKLTEGKVPLPSTILKWNNQSSDWIRRSFKKHSKQYKNFNCIETSFEFNDNEGAPPSSISRSGREGYMSRGSFHHREAGGTLRPNPYEGWGARQSFRGAYDRFANYSAQSQPRGYQAFGYERRCRGRGRLSHNNFVANQYAIKCRAQNITPELTFGVNYKKITGYPANESLNTSLNAVSNN